MTEDKVERINRALDEQKHALDELVLAAQRPAFATERKAEPRATRERKAAFDRYVRKGDAGGLDALELKALSAGSNPDGGYTVPLEIETTIDRVLAKASPIRSIATVRQIGGNVYRKPITTAGAATGWALVASSRQAAAALAAATNRIIRNPPASGTMPERPPLQRDLTIRESSLRVIALVRLCKSRTDSRCSAI